MGLIFSDWKRLHRTGTFQKSLLKLLCYSSKVTRKVNKRLIKLSNNEIYLKSSNLSNSDKYKKPFKFILWPNFLEGHHVLSPNIRDLKLLVVGWGNAVTV